ncbi:hypothetical protein [Tumebacillus permanentifrigoris]|uniref:Uncharacterized protein n=1 Tax=Tumebacillus permanentifrigoris TaxID=378543 RepID=A0A316D7M9_9BACL|nr:hypothetical protein [Tumebacillus permanentifrigoris]PWK05648.1 hypothetical protein C7459_12214 [Tumebacillus permanentifrigoris]
MEFKKGKFAIYHGKEYVLEMDPVTREDVVVTDDPAAISLGFSPWDDYPGDYKKVVKKEDVEYAYECKTYAVYRGRSFYVENVSDNMVLLAHFGLEGSDEALALGFTFVDRWEFTQKVQVDQIEEFRVVTSQIWDLPMPHGHQGE